MSYYELNVKKREAIIKSSQLLWRDANEAGIKARLMIKATLQSTVQGGRRSKSEGITVGKVVVLNYNTENKLLKSQSVGIKS